MGFRGLAHHREFITTPASFLAIGLDDLEESMFECGKELITNLSSENTDTHVGFFELANLRDVVSGISVELDGSIDEVSFSVDEGTQLVAQSFQVLVRPV
jgi:hypothetical protein